MACAVVLGLVVPAWSAHGAGSSPRDAALAAYATRASEIATSIAGGRSVVECADSDVWRRLSAEHGFDPTLTWALTPLQWSSARARPEADGRAILSPRACRLGARLLERPTERGARLCRHGTEVRWVRRPSRGRASGKYSKVRMVVPVWGECDDWGAKLVAMHVVTHESMHLAGVVDEATAECFAMQLDAFVATQLGASSTFARAIAREYWAYYYASQEGRYRSPECRDASSLDLFPGHLGWPTPSAYPSDVARAIARAVNRP